jgi:hypothetical protein
VKINSTQFPCVISHPHSSERSLSAKIWCHIDWQIIANVLEGSTASNFRVEKLLFHHEDGGSRFLWNIPVTAWFSYSVIVHMSTNFILKGWAGCGLLTTAAREHCSYNYTHMPVHVHRYTHKCACTLSSPAHSTTGYWGGYWCPWGREQQDAGEICIMRSFTICKRQISLRSWNRGGWDRYSM